MQPFLIKSSTHCRLLQTAHFQLPSSTRAQTASGIELAGEVPRTPRAHSTTCFGGVGEGRKAPASSCVLSVLLLTRLATLGAGPWLNSPPCPAPSPLAQPISPLHTQCHVQGAELLGLTGGNPASWGACARTSQEAGMAGAPKGPFRDPVCQNLV